MTSKKQPLLKDPVLRVARALFRSVNSTYSRTKLEQLDAGDLIAISRSTIAPSEYDNPSLFAYDYAVHSFLRKLEVRGDSSRLHDEAIQQFLAVEKRIADVNHQLRYLPLKADAEGILSYARRKIESLLGDFNVNEFLSGCQWGPGATSTLKGKDATVDRKVMEGRLSVTSRCLPIARAYLESEFSWMRARIGDNVEGFCSPMASEFYIIEDGRFATVPKDMTRRRSIDIQPTLNLYFQKSVGKMIRRRLKRCGVDLDDQSRNQRLAQAAYSSGLCTIDLESASDSVSSELVRLLLPTDWYQWLDRLRTHSIDIDGTPLRLSKFSAMGNGFTFELESLIFYALCWSVVVAEGGDFETPISVYGDDIIVASKHFERVRHILQQTGFVINDKKSFFTGPFYESCGKHYFKGFDVTPPIQREAMDSAVASVRCANRLWRWAHRMGAGLCLDDVAFQAFVVASEVASSQCTFKHLRKVISLPRQPWYLEGDGGLIDVDFSFQNVRNGRAVIPTLSPLPYRRPGLTRALIREALISERMSELPTYGLVSPRGVVKWIVQKRRVDVYCTRSPEWTCLTAG